MFAVLKTLIFAKAESSAKEYKLPALCLHNSGLFILFYRATARDREEAKRIRGCTACICMTEDVAGRFTTSQDICPGRFLYLFRKRTVVEFMEGTFIYWIGILI